MLQALSTVAAGGGGLQVYPLGKLLPKASLWEILKSQIPNKSQYSNSRRIAPS